MMRKETKLKIWQNVILPSLSPHLSLLLPLPPSPPSYLLIPPPPPSHTSLLPPESKSELNHLQAAIREAEEQFRGLEQDVRSQSHQRDEARLEVDRLAEQIRQSNLVSRSSDLSCLRMSVETSCDIFYC